MKRDTKLMKLHTIEEYEVTIIKGVSFEFISSDFLITLLIFDKLVAEYNYLFRS